MYGGTSNSTLAIGLGSKYIDTQAGLSYQEGARVRLTYDDDNSKWMEGVVQTYFGTRMVVKIDKVNGSGTFADWLINIAGEPGAGEAGEAGEVEVPFAWGDATPKTLMTITANKIIERVTIIITQVFNGAVMALNVGHAGALSDLMGGHENDPANLGTYTVHPGKSYPSDTELLLTITTGLGVSQGAGLVVINYQV